MQTVDRRWVNWVSRAGRSVLYLMSRQADGKCYTGIL
jgi:hypothetical protein